MNEKRIYPFEKNVIWAITICYVLWSAAFIYRSSLVGIDGKRYFSLFDDAMISMRYAWNLSHGIGLIWNPGEYVEGYTNLLMTLIMSFSTLVLDKSTAVLSIQILGVGFMLGSAYLSMRIADHMLQNEGHQRKILVRTLSFLCVLFYYPLSYWSLMGMEVGLLTLLLLYSVFNVLKWVKEPTFSRLVLATVGLGLLFLTRNDSALFTILVFIYAFSEIYKSRPVKVIANYMLAALCLYGLFVIGQETFRLLYYGELLPNTYVLKLTGMTMLSRISNGLGFISVFMVLILPILFVVILDLTYNFHKTKLFLGTLVFTAIGYQVWVGGDPWVYWRIMSPIMPFLFVLFTQAAVMLVDAVSRTTIYKEYVLRKFVFPSQWVSVILVLSLTLIGLLPENIRLLPQVSLFTKPYQANNNLDNVNIAIALNQVTKEDATIGVLWAGAIPYYTGRVSIDFLGKNDKYIARLPPDTSGKVGWNRMNSVPGHNKYDLDYSIKAIQPTYVQTLSYGGQDISEWGKTKYVTVEYKGVRLLLLKDSPAVFWERVSIR